MTHKTFTRIIESWDNIKHCPKFEVVSTPAINDFDDDAFKLRDKYDTEDVDIYHEGLRSLVRSKLLSSLVGSDWVNSINVKTLFHLQQALRDTVEDKTGNIDNATRKVVQDLLTRLSETFSSTYCVLEPLLERGQITYDLLWTLLERGQITYDLLWTLFMPGQIVITATHGDWQDVRAFKFGSISEHDYTIREFSKIEVDIHRFEGPLDIDQLPAFPLSQHRSTAMVSTELIERGKRASSLLLPHHCQYSSHAYIECDDGMQRTHVESRVMVDPPTGFEANPAWTAAKLEDQCIRITQDEQYMIATPVILGYAFTSKSWAFFRVSQLREVSFDREAFSRVVISMQTRSLLQALMENTKRACMSQDSSLRGTASGCTVLLHGSPGTGKTLTAESHCDYYRRSLHRISAGELGSQPKQLEAILTRILRVSQQWQAVVLLDEADVFLERRETGDIQRNSLVTIFLRAFDEFRGMIFLTTNRVEHFDLAVLSRVNACIQYEDLKPAARMTIWHDLMARATGLSSEAAGRQFDMDSLSSHALNGREIRKVIYNASCMVEFERTALDVEHVKRALSVSATSFARFSSIASGSL